MKILSLILTLLTLFFLLPTISSPVMAGSSRNGDGFSEEYKSGWYGDRISQLTAFIFDRRRDKHEKANGCYWEIRRQFGQERYLKNRLVIRKTTRPVRPCSQ